MKGFMYILECCDGSYYTGSTNNIERRLQQHHNGLGAKHTKKRLPLKLVYLEEFQRVQDAFYREKQVQGWNRKKKEALICGRFNKLPELSIAYRDLAVVSRASTTGNSRASTTGIPRASTTGYPGDSTTGYPGASTTSWVPEALEGTQKALEGTHESLECTQKAPEDTQMAISIRV